MASDVAVEIGYLNHPANKPGGHNEHKDDRRDGQNAAHPLLLQKLIPAFRESGLKLWREGVSESSGLVVEPFQFCECGAAIELFFDVVDGSGVSGFGLGFKAFFPEPVKGGSGDVEQLVGVVDI